MSNEKNRPDLQENKMGVMPIGKLLVNMATPMIISMLVQALYNVVDSIYVSRISESAVTALSLAFPIQNLLIGFGVGIGVGVNSLLSKSLGQKNQEQANFTAGNGLTLMLIVSVGFMIFGAVGVESYYRIQSQVAETVEKLDGKVTALEQKPVKRIDSLVDKIIWAVCGAVITFLLARMGL